VFVIAEIGHLEKVKLVIKSNWKGWLLEQFKTTA